MVQSKLLWVDLHPSPPDGSTHGVCIHLNSIKTCSKINSSKNNPCSYHNYVIILPLMSIVVNSCHTSCPKRHTETSLSSSWLSATESSWLYVNETLVYSPIHGRSYQKMLLSSYVFHLTARSSQGGRHDKASLKPTAAKGSISKEISAPISSWEPSTPHLSSMKSYSHATHYLEAIIRINQ